MIAADKSFIGMAITVGELIKVLEGDLFNKTDLGNPVTLTTESSMVEPLTAVFKCGKCSALHFESGWFIDVTAGFHHDDVIYEDKCNDEGEYISRGELLDILKDNSIKKNTPIVISCSVDMEAYKLLVVYRCSNECETAHLAFTEEPDINLN